MMMMRLTKMIMSKNPGDHGRKKSWKLMRKMKKNMTMNIRIRVKVKKKRNMKTSWTMKSMKKIKKKSTMRKKIMMKNLPDVQGNLNRLEMKRSRVQLQVRSLQPS